ncbi:MAG: NAD(P)H-hydrate dehydratase, partial [Gammaproteobacteria bacterium]
MTHPPIDHGLVAPDQWHHSGTPSDPRIAGPHAGDLYTAAACRALDDAGSAAHGITGYDLMQRAGEAALALVLSRWPAARGLTICCGKGHNAGDGYVVAARAQSLGLAVELLEVVPPYALQGDAVRARRDALAAGVVPRGEWPSTAAGDVIVDALLGTGCKGDLRPTFAAAVRWINSAGRPVLALDLPSGVDADTGAVSDPVLQADATLQFVGRKLGLHTGPGVTAAGERHFAALGLDAALYRQHPGVPWLRWPMLPARARLPRRPRDAWKQQFGHMAVLGGDEDMGGAVILAAEAALRVGAGLVTVITRAVHRAPLLARRPEVMVVAADHVDACAGALARATCLVVGPGLGRGAWGLDLLEAALATRKPLVLDADGLQCLAALGRQPRAPVVATPHPGEAAALLGVSSREIQRDRPAAALALAARVGGAVVLKGAGSLIADAAADHPARLLGVCGHGNPGMATAGTGDVLAGLVGGLL